MQALDTWKQSHGSGSDSTDWGSTKSEGWVVFLNFQIKTLLLSFIEKKV